MLTINRKKHKQQYYFVMKMDTNAHDNMTENNSIPQQESSIINSITANNKINFSLSKKKKKKQSRSQDDVGNKDDEKKTSVFHEHGQDDENGFSTIAEAASNATERRKELGVELVIPLNKTDEERKKNEPLLSGMKRIIQGDDDGNDNNDDDDDGDDARKANVDKHIDEDKEAEDALIEMANGNDAESSSTFHSSSSNIVIKQSQLRQKKEIEPVNDTIKYQRDLQHRAKDIPVDSQAYVNVPIAEFGAAMLRGMGWKNNDSGSNENRNQSDKKSNNEEGFNPRPHRLGLGATALPPSMKESEKNSGKGNSRRHWARKGGTMGDIAHLEKQEEEEKVWKQKIEDKKKNDVQITLQVGSVVRLRQDDKRAKMVKIAGVPGLNRVLIKFEGEKIDVSVKKSDVVLVDKSEIEQKPFDEKAANINDRYTESRDSGRNKNDDRSQSDGDESIEYQDKIKSSKKSRSCERRERHRNHKSKRERRDKERSRNHRDDKSRDKRHEKEDGEDRERSRRKGDAKRSESKRRNREERDNNTVEMNDERQQKRSKYDHDHWLTPNIRVRVVSKKIAKGRQFKQKGVVVDVLNRGADAVLHMDNGDIIERIPERYLETALPKVGGHVIVLTGSSQFSKGKLLERNSQEGKGVIQFYEDMNVLQLSLDDMAEYCGPIDDDYEH